MMHFFNFDKFNLARQTLLHLISERGTITNRIVETIGKMICGYISEKIKMNRHLKVDLNIADSNGWTPFLQLCYKNDPLAITMAAFAHEQVTYTENIYLSDEINFTRMLPFDIVILLALY